MSTRRDTLPRLALPALLAALALAVVAVQSRATGSDASARRTVECAELEVVLARLDELAATLAGLEERGCTHPTTFGVSESAEAWRTLQTDIADLSQGLAKMEEAMADLRLAPTRAQVGIVSAARSELATLRESRPEVDWFALDRVVSAWERDSEAAREALRFLSPAELLERFGAPTRVRGEDDGEVRWTYGEPTEGAPRPYRVSLSLHDGYVTDARVVGERERQY